MAERQAARAHAWPCIAAGTDPASEQDGRLPGRRPPPSHALATTMATSSSPYSALCLRENRIPRAASAATNVLNARDPGAGWRPGLPLWLVPMGRVGGPGIWIRMIRDPSFHAQGVSVPLRGTIRSIGSRDPGRSRRSAPGRRLCAYVEVVKVRRVVRVGQRVPVRIEGYGQV